MESKKCLAIGAGAIGRSITGYVFRALGFQVLFAEIDPAVIAQIDRAGGYRLFSTATGERIAEHRIAPVRAVDVSSEAAAAFAGDADVICTAVGAVNVPDAVRAIAGWLRERPQGRRLDILLLENGSGLKTLAERILTETLGALPEGVVISHACIERITKKITGPDGGADAVSEEFLRPTLTAAPLAGTLIADHPELFELVDNVDRYYYRKLYINNIGHGVMSYMGCRRGYQNTTEAIADPEILEVLRRVWDASAQMICKKYGFTRREVDDYAATRMQCYRNTALADPLQRLSRAPIRKLGRQERIIGSAALCCEYGIPVDAFIPVFCCAVHYDDPADPQCAQLRTIREEQGIEGVLRSVCGLAPGEPLYAILLEGYRQQAEKYL